MKNFFYNIIGAAVFLGMSITTTTACEDQGIDVAFEVQIIADMYASCVANKEDFCDYQRRVDTENLMIRVANQEAMIATQGEEL